MKKLKRLLIALTCLHAMILRDGVYWQGGLMENLNGAEPNFSSDIAFQFADAMIKKEKK